MSSAKKLRQRLRQTQERIRELLRQIQRLRQQNEELQQEKEKWQREREQLQEEVEHWKRQSYRQAAPFRRPQRRKISEPKKKKPGRRAGHSGSYRQIPSWVDRELKVELDQCPHCGGEVSERQTIEQWIEDLPVTRPEVTRIVTQRGVCAGCGPVSSHHPEQVSHACGAARVQLGPRALARAVELNKELGLSMRKTCRILKQQHGLSLTAGGLSQALDRVADRLQDPHRQLRRDLQRSPAVYADETSWWVGQPGWWLWVLTDPETILYQVEDHRSARVVEQLLGADFEGTLISDCLATYNTLPYRQHKCIAHHLKAISEQSQKASREGARYLSEWKLLLASARALYSRAVEDNQPIPPELQNRLQQWARRLLDHPVVDPAAQAIHQRLDKQRLHLLGCLKDLAVEPTNNRAERALRPAVIARKISCGNKTVAGKRTWEILASLTATYRLRGWDFVDSVTPYLTLPPRQPPPG